MSTFKFLTNTDYFIAFEPNFMLPIRNYNGNDNYEYCFQFEDHEPFVFATGSGELSIRLSPNNDSNITFNQDGRRFRLFARGAQE